MKASIQRLGTVVNTAQNLVVVRAPESASPSIGTVVIDESLDDVGRIVDVFGPVDRPYVAVDPRSDTQVVGLLGTTVYARP